MAKDMNAVAFSALRDRFNAVRSRAEALSTEFSAEDLCVQTMPDVSPGKWHLAHVTWFWETFLLSEALPGYQPFDQRFNYLFNSYYEAIGERHARPERGFLTRPGLEEVLAYRAHVDRAVNGWFDQASVEAIETYRTVIETGFAHEEQHQELFLTDIKHVLSRNSFSEAAYARTLDTAPDLIATRPDPVWLTFEGGLAEFGHEGDAFAFDNEGPRHKAWLDPFALASRPVSNAEYLAFIEDDGYGRPEFWLSEGWARMQDEGRTQPFYWRRRDGRWTEFTLHGEQALHPDAPVSHLDYFEASAFASWAGARLPEEREWEQAAQGLVVQAGRWASADGLLHPQPQTSATDLQAMFGEVWEWTRSAYSAYPGFAPAAGAIGEYNGKFMCGQFVLRGGSCLTAPDHARTTYRNFFPPDAQWQMTGLRLAKDL
jgi:ergothioneine biosynthesis protein EgtB